MSIGQALVSNPRYLMLDEPSAGVAPSLFADIVDIGKALLADGITEADLERRYVGRR